MKKKLLAILALTFTATLSVGATQAINASANVEPTAITLSEATIALDGGASVRMDAPYGIRFGAYLNAEQYAGLKQTYANVEVGMLICPTDLITEGKTLDFDTSDGLVLENEPEQNNPEFGYVAVPEEQFVFDSETNTYTVYGALVGINENNLSRPFTARAYIRALDSEGNATADTPVYSATTTSRAIYSVATYAVADSTIDFTGDKAACKTFLNDIIDEVQAYYGDLTVSVTSDNAETAQYGILNDGDTVRVSATVAKNGDNTRVLDACPVLFADAETGITLTQVSKNEYVINGLNETGYNLSASVGVIGETNTQTVSGVFTTPVKSWEKDIIDDVARLSKLGGASSIVLQEEGNFVGTYVWSGYNQLWFPALSTGDIVRVDVNAQNGFLATMETSDVDGDKKRLEPTNIYNGSTYPQFAGTLTGTDGVDYVDFRLLTSENQELISKALGNYKAEWVTVEITAKRDFAEKELRLFHTTVAGSYPFENFYIRNVKVQRYALGYELSYPTEFGLIAETECKIEISKNDKRGISLGTQSTAITATGASATMSYQTAGDFAGAYKYSPNIYNGTAHASNTGNNLAYAAFKGNTTGSTLVCQKDSYMYISLYQIKKYNLALKIGGHTILIYNGANQTLPAGIELKVYKYDTDGNPYTINYGTNGDGANSSLNMWVTFEVHFTQEATLNLANDFALYMYTRDTSAIAGTDNENYCYLRNVQFSATQKTLKLSDLQGA